MARKSVSLFERNAERIRREAADWKIRLGERPGDDLRADFQRWYDADPRHGAAYDRMDAIWSSVSSLSPAAVAAASAGHWGWRLAGPRFALAASVLLVAVLLSVILISRERATAPPGGRTLVYATVVGEIREARLEDGSRLILDSASRVEARFDHGERRFVLRKGRARFAVARESRPFVVQAGSNQVLATGTLFDVSLIGGRMAVLLIEGSVQVGSVDDAAGRAPERLGPGQKLVLVASAPPLRRAVARGETMWPNRMLAFEDTPLQDAAALANRYSRTQLVVANERIALLRVTGAYRAGDIRGFARSLAAAFNLRMETQNNGDLLLVDADRPGQP